MRRSIHAYNMRRIPKNTYITTRTHTSQQEHVGTCTGHQKGFIASDKHQGVSNHTAEIRSTWKNILNTQYSIRLEPRIHAHTRTL